jgi:PAS domain S-box-containing protein
MLGIHSDITAQRNAEHALQLARFAIEHTTDAVYWTDDHTRILEVNDAACRALGYSREELTTLTLADIDPDFSADNRPIHWDHVPPGGTYTLERRHRTKDGRTFPVEVLTSLITTGGRRFGCSFARDISARKQVEEELHHREHLLLESQRVARLGSYDFDIGRGTWICSRMLEELFGIPPDYPKDVPHWLAIIHPDHRTVMEHYLLDHVVRGRHPFDREYRVVRPQDGVELWVHGLGELECDEAGVPLHMIGTIQDITNEHRINEEIRRLNEELELRVRERTAQLEAANRELESFSYSVSHDLRAPLRAVDGFSKALLEDYGEAFDGEGRDYLHRVRAGAQRMGCLIDDLLRLSRISRADLRRIPVDLSALATSILDDLRQNDPGRTVEVVIAPGAVASVDPGLIQIVFENLLRNAWTFTSKHPTARIEFGCATRSDSAAWFIRDDGAGFDMAYAEKLFGVFQRLHRAEEFPGTGIGLATVQRIIHRHGGRIWAEGAVEHGATFTFTLPPPIH